MVGEYLEIGKGHEEWDDEQNEDVDDIIRDGIQIYYYPPMLESPYAAVPQELHEWSFMRPTWTFKTASDVRRYPLPENFERPVGTITFTSPDNQGYAPINFVSPSSLRAADAAAEMTSYPLLAAIEPGESTGDAPQELLLVLHPTPDAVYTLSLQYQAMGRMLTEDHPYPMGGQIHGPAILQSCLAVAEFRKTGDLGPMHQRFMQLLSSNVVRDRQRGGKVLGYNGNPMTTSVTAQGQLRDSGMLFYDVALYNNTDYSSGV